MSWKQWDIGEVVEAGDFQSLVQDQVVQTYADAAARGLALGTAVSEGMVAYTSDNDTLSVYNGSQWGQVAQAISPNYIINGGFDIWQRGTSFSGNLNNTFTADRWATIVSTSEAGLNWSLTQQSFTPADLVASNYGEGQFYLRSTLTAIGSSTDPRLRYRIEDVRTLAGQTVTLSFYVRSSTNSQVRFLGVQNFGTGGSGSITFGESDAQITSTFTRFTSTFTIPAIGGKTIGAGSNLELRIRYASAISNGDNLDIWGVQLEAGSVATPFRRNANSIQGELAACQRYYYRITSGQAFTQLCMAPAVSTTALRGQIWHPVPLRTNSSFSSSGSYQTTGGAAVTLSVSSQNNNYTFINFAGTGFTLNDAHVIRDNNDANAYVEFSAEL